MKFCNSDPSFNRNILRSLYLKFNPSAHAHIAITYSFVLFTNFLSYSILNVHWGYILISKVGQWFYQLDHVTFSKSLFWSVKCTLFYNQTCSVQMLSLYLVEELAFKVRNCTLDSISRKSHVTTFMTLSVDAILSRAIRNVTFQLTLCRQTFI